MSEEEASEFANNAAKAEFEDATAAVEIAKQQLKAAEERQQRAKSTYLKNNIKGNSPWNTMYNKLVLHKEEFDGDMLVLTTKDSSADLKKLAKWVQNQRVHYKYYMNGDTKFIKEDRIVALNKIGFVWNVNDHAWDANFQSLLNYHAEHGNFDIPKKFSTKLNTFVTNLRKAMRRKKEGLLQKELTDDRIDRLNAINFTWEMKNPGRQKETGDNVSFDHLYDLLVEFKDQYGHTQVAKQSKIWRSGGEKGPTRPEYKRLPFFLASVRSEHEIFLQGKPCALDAEKVRKLTELGVQWKKPASDPRGKKRKSSESNTGSEIEVEAAEPPSDTVGV